MEYTDELLKKVQDVELSILDDFIEICEKNNLKYFAVSGTALGAVRHNGLIPWDDDIDIGILRKDFDKFVEVAKKEYSDKYDIVTAGMYEDSAIFNVHWSKKGTVFANEESSGRTYPSGIFLDIFPFDNAADDDKKMHQQGKRAWIWQKLLTLYINPKPTLHFSNFKNNIITFICIIIHFFLVILRITPKKCFNKAMKYLRMYDDEKTSRVAFFCGTKPFTTIHAVKDLENLVETTFNGRKMYLANNYDEVLTNLYGDYMQLPPIEKRYNHAPNIIKFGDKDYSN